MQGFCCNKSHDWALFDRFTSGTVRISCHDLEEQVSAEGDFASREHEFGVANFRAPNFGAEQPLKSGFELFAPYRRIKNSSLKNSPSRHSPPQIHIRNTPPPQESGLKKSYCTSAEPFCWCFWGKKLWNDCVSDSRICFSWMIFWLLLCFFFTISLGLHVSDHKIERPQSAKTFAQVLSDFTASFWVNCL